MASGPFVLFSYYSKKVKSVRERKLALDPEYGLEPEQKARARAEREDRERREREEEERRRRGP